MPVLQRLDWIVRQVGYGRAIHCSLGHAADTSKFKVKITLAAANEGPSPPIVSEGVLSMLNHIRNMLVSYSSCDRGHKHSNGKSVISIWIASPTFGNTPGNLHSSDPPSNADAPLSAGGSTLPPPPPPPFEPEDECSAEPRRVVPLGSSMVTNAPSVSEQAQQHDYLQAQLAIIVTGFTGLSEILLVAPGLGVSDAQISDYTQKCATSLETANSCAKLLEDPSSSQPPSYQAFAEHMQIEVHRLRSLCDSMMQGIT